MKALSIAQPWAGMIMDAIKDIEIRNWSLCFSRLPIRIAIISCKQISPIKPDMTKGIGPLTKFIYNSPRLMPRGMILGDVLLTEIKTYYDIETFRADAEKHRVPHTYYKPGIRGWKLEDPRKLKKPRPYRGRLSLFEIPDNELD